MNLKEWIELENMAKDVYTAAIRADMPALISKVRLLQAHLPQNEYYLGEYVYVAKVNKRDGRTGYTLRRMGGAVLQEFPDLDYANRIAQYIDEHGGSYEADARRAAKLFVEGESK